VQSYCCCASTCQTFHQQHLLGISLTKSKESTSHQFQSSQTSFSINQSTGFSPTGTVTPAHTKRKTATTMVNSTDCRSHTSVVGVPPDLVVAKAYGKASADGRTSGFHKAAYFLVLGLFAAVVGVAFFGDMWVVKSKTTSSPTLAPTYEAGCWNGIETYLEYLGQTQSERVTALECRGNKGGFTIPPSIGRHADLTSIV
jgi:hypothetical protein